MKSILTLFLFITLTFSQNKKLEYKIDKAFTESELVRINKFCAKNKKIYSIDIDNKNKKVIVETRGSVEPKLIDQILAQTGFKFTSVTKNLAKTSTVDAQSRVR